MRRKFATISRETSGLMSIGRSLLAAALRTQWYILHYFCWWRSKIRSQQTRFVNLYATEKDFPENPYPDSFAYAGPIIGTLFSYLSQVSFGSIRYFLLNMSTLPSSLGFLGGKV